MGLRIYNKPVLTDPMGGYMIDLRSKGVYADLSTVKHIGAPFGAVSWTSPDWDEVLPAERQRRVELLTLLKSRIKEGRSLARSGRIYKLEGR